MKDAKDLLLSAQFSQQSHDRRAHADILNLDTHTRLKHMILHFLKYAGKLVEAQEQDDKKRYENTLLDIFIICLATANSLNLNLGKTLNIKASSLSELAFALKRTEEDYFSHTLYDFLRIAGKMAKAIESTDHLEKGDPRSDLEVLISDLTLIALRSLGNFGTEIDEAVRLRWCQVERKSIFSGLTIEEL